MLTALAVTMISYAYFEQREERKEEYYILLILATLVVAGVDRMARDAFIRACGTSGAGRARKGLQADGRRARNLCASIRREGCAADRREAAVRPLHQGAGAAGTRRHKVRHCGT